MRPCQSEFPIASSTSRGLGITRCLTGLVERFSSCRHSALSRIAHKWAILCMVGEEQRSTRLFKVSINSGISIGNFTVVFTWTDFLAIILIPGTVLIVT